MELLRHGSLQLPVGDGVEPCHKNESLGVRATTWSCDPGGTLETLFRRAFKVRLIVFSDLAFV